ncbi:thermonuclease family protein [Pseudanabaena sp. PCC 6802]|uniref:thermonuclease family protein n=1 Tax=Pseudanabaena sp. PCC 6802 TaxID=118173 RepID=UPI00034A792C|nr:thermonuclease family protein [Pseudanabaena sp. PCC 6802]
MSKQDRSIVSNRKTKRYRLWLILLLLLVLLNLGLGWFRGNAEHSGEAWVVKRVVSGQTIEAQLASDSTEIVQRVRLIGISAPLREQSPWGERAQQRLEKLTNDRKVMLEFDTERKDNSDRLLAYVWLDNRLINAQMIEEGYVLAESLPPNVKYERKFELDQRKARLLEVGIWDTRNPMRLSPKEFRRQSNQNSN